MKKLLILGISMIALTLAGSLVVLAAKPNITRQLTNVNPSEGRAAVVIPQKAIEMSPGVFSLGKALDQDRRLVEGYAFVDFRQSPAKPGTQCGNGVCESGENVKKCPADCGSGGEPDAGSCYGFLAKGAKWKTTESYLVDPVNTESLDELFVRVNLALDIDKWETAAGVNILGDEIAGIVDGADLSSPDNKNEVYFGSIDSPGAIAVTVVWGIFRGAPQNRELVEWDQIYDQVDFDWSATGEPAKMDFENIATHELGHSIGLADLYESACSQQTMYGYAENGEIKKQTLETGDIAGAKELYK